MINPEDIKEGDFILTREGVYIVRTKIIRQIHDSFPFMYFLTDGKACFPGDVIDHYRVPLDLYKK